MMTRFLFYAENRFDISCTICTKCQSLFWVFSGKKMNIFENVVWWTFLYSMLRVNDWQRRRNFDVTKTRLYNFNPLKPHFYLLKLWFTGVYIIFLISAQKHRLWVLVRTASLTSTHNRCFGQKYENIRFFYVNKFSFWRWNFQYIWIGVFSLWLEFYGSVNIVKVMSSRWKEGTNYLPIAGTRSVCLLPLMVAPGVPGSGIMRNFCSKSWKLTYVEIKLIKWRNIMILF